MAPHFNKKEKIKIADISGSNGTLWQKSVLEDHAKLLLILHLDRGCFFFFVLLISVLFSTCLLDLLLTF